MDAYGKVAVCLALALVVVVVVELFRFERELRRLREAMPFRVVPGGKAGEGAR